MAVGKIKSFQVDTSEIAEKASVDALEPYAKAYDITGGAVGLPTASAAILTFICVRAFSLPTNLSGSASEAGTASTGTAVFSIQKNGSQFATLTFTTSSMGVFSGTGTSFTAGDILTVVAPASQDATLSDVYFTIAGTMG